MPEKWQVLSEPTQAQVPGKAEAMVRPMTTMEARSLKGALQFQSGGIVHVDLPERWMVEVDDGATATYYVFWPVGDAGCLATVRLTRAEGQELQAEVLQVVDAAGLPR